MSKGDDVVCKKRFLKIISTNDQRARLSLMPWQPPLHAFLPPKKGFNQLSPVHHTPMAYQISTPKLSYWPHKTVVSMGPVDWSPVLLKHFALILNLWQYLTLITTSTFSGLFPGLLFSSNRLSFLASLSPHRSRSPEIDSNMKARVKCVCEGLTPVRGEGRRKWTFELGSRAPLVAPGSCGGGEPGLSECPASRRNGQVFIPAWLNHRCLVPGKDRTLGGTALYSGEDAEGAESWMLFSTLLVAGWQVQAGSKGNPKWGSPVITPLFFYVPLHQAVTQNPKNDQSNKPSPQKKNVCVSTEKYIASDLKGLINSPKPTKVSLQWIHLITVNQLYLILLLHFKAHPNICQGKLKSQVPLSSFLILTTHLWVGYQLCSIYGGEPRSWENKWFAQDHTGIRVVEGGGSKRKKVLFTSAAPVSSTLSLFLNEVLNSQGACKLKGAWETRQAHK